MIRNKILLLTLFVSVLGFGQSSDKKPNFLFILVDDLGYMDIGANNPETFYETPNIDALAQKGVRFTNAYAASPVCSPTRASILTGKSPARNDNTAHFGAPQPYQKNRIKKDKPLLPARYKDYMDLNEVTIAEALQEGGYKTFFAGKWHLGCEGKWPEHQGFQINKGGWTKGGPYGGKQYFSPYGNPSLEDGKDGEHLPDRLATETVGFIKENKDKPFFAYLSFYSVHTPLIGRPDLVEKYKKKRQQLVKDNKIWGKEGERKVRLTQDHAVYAAMVEAMDQAVGKVLNSLKEQGLDKNTVVFFMSDNGGLSTSEGHPTSNVPLRAGKGWLYEGGIREPMIISFPGTVDSTVENTPVISMDFYPTMLELAGLEMIPEQHKDGTSLVSLLTDGKKIKRKVLYWHYPHWGNQGGTPGSVVRMKDYKLIKYFTDKPTELFNLKKDISETTNIIGSKKRRAHKMEKMLKQWLVEMEAKFPSPNPNFKPDSHKVKVVK